MPDRANLLADIADAADDLTEPHQHLEPIYEWTAQRNRRQVRVHRVRLPSLLDQLAAMFAPGSAGEQGGRGVPGSRPPLRLDAVSVHSFIGAGAARWAWSLRLEIRDTTASTIRGLVGAAGVMDSDTQVSLLGELCQWRHQAQVLTGWKTPPYRPFVACPLCDRVGGLRVHLGTQTAACVRCWATWTPDTVGVLAAHVLERTSVKVVAA